MSTQKWLRVLLQWETLSSGRFWHETTTVEAKLILYCTEHRIYHIRPSQKSQYVTPPVSPPSHARGPQASLAARPHVERTKGATWRFGKRGIIGRFGPSEWFNPLFLARRAAPTTKYLSLLEDASPCLIHQATGFLLPPLHSKKIPLTTNLHQELCTRWRWNSVLSVHEEQRRGYWSRMKRRPTQVNNNIHTLNGLLAPYRSTASYLTRLYRYQALIRHHPVIICKQPLVSDNLVITAPFYFPGVSNKKPSTSTLGSSHWAALVSIFFNFLLCCSIQSGGGISCENPASSLPRNPLCNSLARWSYREYHLPSDAVLGHSPIQKHGRRIYQFCWFNRRIEAWW